VCVLGWNCLPLALALAIEVAATSVIGRFVTARERVMVSRSSTIMSSFMFNRKGKSHQLGCTSIIGFRACMVAIALA
jgi:hypothetical protein